VHCDAVKTRAGVAANRSICSGDGHDGRGSHSDGSRGDGSRNG